MDTHGLMLYHLGQIRSTLRTAHGLNGDALAQNGHSLLPPDAGFRKAVYLFYKQEDANATIRKFITVFTKLP